MREFFLVQRNRSISTLIMCGCIRMHRLLTYFKWFLLTFTRYWVQDSSGIYFITLVAEQCKYCTIICYKLYHHICFGLCCGPHDKAMLWLCSTWEVVGTRVQICNSQKRPLKKHFYFCSADSVSKAEKIFAKSSWRKAVQSVLSGCVHIWKHTPAQHPRAFQHGCASFLYTHLPALSMLQYPLSPIHCKSIHCTLTAFLNYTTWKLYTKLLTHPLYL